MTGPPTRAPARWGVVQARAPCRRPAPRFSRTERPAAHRFLRERTNRLRSLHTCPGNLLGATCEPDRSALVGRCRICSQGGKRFAQARMSGRDSDQVKRTRSVTAAQRHRPARVAARVAKGAFFRARGSGAGANCFPPVSNDLTEVVVGDGNLSPDYSNRSGADAFIRGGHACGAGRVGRRKNAAQACDSARRPEWRRATFLGTLSRSRVFPACGAVSVANGRVGFFAIHE